MSDYTRSSSPSHSQSEPLSASLPESAALGLDDVDLFLDLPNPDVDMDAPSDSEFPDHIPLPPSAPPASIPFDEDSDYYPPASKCASGSEFYYGSDEEDSDAEDLRPRQRRRLNNKGPEPKSSWARQKKLNAASKAPTFAPNSSKVGNFQEKILEDDPKAEFDRGNIRRVRCSHCTEWVVMRVVYDIRRWTEHRNTAKCLKAQGAGLSTQSLLSLGFTKAKGRIHIVVPPPPPPPKLQPLPCPGLTQESNEKIAIYMARSSANGGGAPSRARIAKELFGLDSQWDDLSASERRMVVCREVSLYKWRMGRGVGAIFASDCLRDVLTPIGGDPEPCSSCCKLLKLHTFQVALNRRMPDESNMKHVPKVHRDKDLGELYLKYRGVRELVDLVSYLAVFPNFSN
jgi:hypothetical protein